MEFPASALGRAFNVFLIFLLTNTLFFCSSLDGSLLLPIHFTTKQTNKNKSRSVGSLRYFSLSTHALSIFANFVVVRPFVLSHFVIKSSHFVAPVTLCNNTWHTL